MEIFLACVFYLLLCWVLAKVVAKVEVSQKRGFNPLMSLQYDLKIDDTDSWNKYREISNYQAQVDDATWEWVFIISIGGFILGMFLFFLYLSLDGHGLLQSMPIIDSFTFWLIMYFLLTFILIFIVYMYRMINWRKQENTAQTSSSHPMPSMKPDVVKFMGWKETHTTEEDDVAKHKTTTEILRSGTYNTEERLRALSNDLTHSTGFSGKFNPDDIKTYPINDILKSGKFTALERKQEYRRRGKSPSGVIDGEYNDMYRGNDEYNDSLRDWEADA